MGVSTFTFPYRYKYILEGKIIDPLISLPVKTSIGWQNAWFLLDSGADTTMLTLSFAKAFGLWHDNKKRVKLYGIAGKSVYAYPGKIELKIASKVLKVRCYYIDAQDSTFLLGRLDIFDKFSIIFDSVKKQIILKNI